MEGSVELGTLVEAASWDITLGVAGTGLGRLILSATSESEEVAPDSIDHIGIKIFGNLYEYGDLGILTSPLPEDDSELKSKYPAFSLRSLEELGYTNRTMEEFDAWVEEMNNSDFKGSNYDLVTTSCVVWGKRAAEYLGVPNPPNWDRIILWTQKHKGFTSIVGSTGLGARHLQHKATEYAQNPSKIKAKVKGLYKRIRRKRNAENDENNGEEPPEGEEGEDDDDDSDEDEENPEETTATEPEET
ncbi:unnamed protein product [Allacma fusca]|uniref:PPPDE domain-containing protein n=1 Tax=Allacma fusca TaxID=39272 RepID=A0A8J2L776_9HEXA|nr:unnamed protein product [Allacma fusca]